MTPERLAAYVILAPLTIAGVAALLWLALVSVCWLWKTFSGVANEVFPPEPEPREAPTPDHQKAALRGLCDHIKGSTARKEQG